MTAAAATRPRGKQVGLWPGQGMCRAQRANRNSSCACPFLGLPDEVLLKVLSAGHFDACTLGRLALCSKRFSHQRQPLALVEELARVSVRCRPDAARMPRRTNERWLWILHELELLSQPLAFTCYPAHVDLYESGAVAVIHPQSGGFQGELDTDTTVICGRSVMRRGLHRARFTVLHNRYHWLTVGIAAVDPVHGPSSARCTRWSSDDNGFAWHAGFDGAARHGGEALEWRGMEGFSVGETVELCLNLEAEQGTLTAWKNGTQLGVLAHGLLLQRDAESGQQVGFCWMAEMSTSGDAVRVVNCPLRRGIDIIM